MKVLSTRVVMKTKLISESSKTFYSPSRPGRSRREGRLRLEGKDPDAARAAPDGSTPAAASAPPQADGNAPIKVRAAAYFHRLPQQFMEYCNLSATTIKIYEVWESPKKTVNIQTES